MSFPDFTALKGGFSNVVSGLNSIASALAANQTQVNVSHNGAVVWSGVLPASAEWVTLLDNVNAAMVSGIAHSNGVYEGVMYALEHDTDAISKGTYRMELVGSTIRARSSSGYDVDFSVSIIAYPLGENTVGGIVGPVGPAGLVDFGAWQNFSFQANWSNYGAPYGNCQYRIAGDMVQLRGMAICADYLSNTVVSFLPLGYRPQSQIVFNLWSQYGTYRFDVYPDGRIRYRDSGSTNGLLSLDNIQFYTS